MGIGWLLQRAERIDQAREKPKLAMVFQVGDSVANLIPQQRHEARCGRVHPSLPAPCPAGGFVKIRHFGLLANRNRRPALALCRFHLGTTAADLSTLLSEK